MTPSDLELLALLTLRLRGFVDTDAFAQRWSVAPAVTADVLGWLADTGLATRRDGKFTGWCLTTAGRIEGERRLLLELETHEAGLVVRDGYERFVSLNADFLALCTRWHVRTVDGRQVPNDHDDPVEDQRSIDALGAVHEAIVPALTDLARALARFGCYRPRLSNALRRVRAGEAEWFTAPSVDSYHTVWFELHENLLATLNVERSSEPRIGGL
jgi:hypothetical protein